MLTCRDAHALIVRTIDDASLPAAARLTLRRHLSACTACREEYDTQHEVRRLLALHVEEQPPAGFDARLRARLAEVSPRANPQPPPAPKQPPAPRLPTAPRPPRAAVLSTSQLLSTGRRTASLRRWALRLLPIAATLAVIAADARLPGIQIPPLTSRPAPAPASASASPIASPAMAPPAARRDAAAARRRQVPRPSTDVLLHAPGAAPAAAPTLAAAMPASGIAAASSTDADADGLADVLKLSTTQRRQIEEITDQRRQTLQDILENTRKRVELERHHTDAAIERVLTPEQRKQYRAHAATRERERERNASEGWTLLPPSSTMPLPLPPTQPPLPQPPFEP